MNRKPGPFLQKNIFYLLMVLCLLQWNNVAVSASDSRPDPPFSQAQPFRLAHWGALTPSWLMWGEDQIVTDFDGDKKADVATARFIGDQYRVVIYLSSRPDATSLGSLAQLAGSRLFACDINKDGFQDVVVATPIAPHPLAIWLGNGKGGFRTADQERFDNRFGFTASPTRYDSPSFSLQQDLLTESSRPVCEKPILAFWDLDLEGNGFICWKANIHPLRNGYFSRTPRSPPIFLPFQGELPWSGFGYSWLSAGTSMMPFCRKLYPRRGDPEMSSLPD